MHNSLAINSGSSTISSAHSTNPKKSSTLILRKYSRQLLRNLSSVTFIITHMQCLHFQKFLINYIILLKLGFSFRNGSSTCWFCLFLIKLSWHNTLHGPHYSVTDCIPCILRLNLMKLPPLQHTGISEVTYPHIRYISSRITGFGRNYEVSTVCKCISLRTVGSKHEYELLFRSSRLSVTINFKMAWLISAWLSIIVILSWRQCWFVFIENARWNRMNAAVAGKRRETVF